MRGVFARGRRACAAGLLVVVLLAPAALAADSRDASRWTEFVVWLQGRLDIPGGVALADEAGFMAWLRGRIGIPNG